MENMSSEELMVRYLIAREKERDEAFTRLWDRLSEREQALVREAAVLGHTLGFVAAGGTPTSQYPTDSAVVRDVVLSAQSHYDLYPNLRASDT